MKYAEIAPVYLSLHLPNNHLALMQLCHCALDCNRLTSGRQRRRASARLFMFLSRLCLEKMRASCNSRLPRLRSQFRTLQNRHLQRRSGETCEIPDNTETEVSSEKIDDYLRQITCRFASLQCFALLRKRSVLPIFPRQCPADKTQNPPPRFPVLFCKEDSYVHCIIVLPARQNPKH